MALLSAYRLKIISQYDFDSTLSKVLASLERLPLFDDHLPNKSYNTASLEMVNYDNSPTARGIGWSAIDIGRILIPFNIIVWNYSTYTPAVQRILRGIQLPKKEIMCQSLQPSR